MKILVINCGSSSLKYQLIDMETEEVMAKGNFERIGEESSFVTHKVNGEKYVIEKTAMNHTEAFEVVIEQLTNSEYGVVKSLSEINAIGHRIVAGGEYFDKSELVTPDVKDKIAKCIPLGPLHNPAALQGIKACEELMPGVPMVVTFDTAFHQTMPEENYLYPIPYEYYEKYRIRKYGAHGTSHQFVSKICAEMYGKPIEDLKIVTCHLGQGASICAVDGGKSIDTSMGLSPLGGIAMVTRSGDLDPTIVTEIMEREGLTPKEANTLLNKKSGLSGITGLDPDFREIASHYDDKANPRAKVAIDIFNKTIAQFIARYAVSLGGLDAIVFTGGIGENQISTRVAVCKHLEFMGVKIDEAKNNVKSEQVEVTGKDSKVRVFIIPTNEELVIARDTKEIVERL